MSPLATCTRFALPTLLFALITSPGSAQTSYGSGCAGTMGIPALSYGGSTNVGQTVDIYLAGARSSTLAALLFGSAPATISLDPFGATGCQLLVPVGSISLSLQTNSRGNGLLQVKLPNTPSLVNAQIYNQFAIIDRGVNNLGLTTSNGGRFVIGPARPSAVDNDSLDIRVEPDVRTPKWISTESPTFVTIPEMAASFVTNTNSVPLAITFSAEAYTSHPDSRMMVRALVDGIVAAPSDIVFTRGPLRGSRSFAFRRTVGPGIHTVEIQWLRDPSGPLPATAHIRTRSLEIRRAPSSKADGTLTVTTPPSGRNLVTTSSSWNVIQGTTTSFYAPPGASLTVGFSAESFVSQTGKRMLVRAVLDGAPLSPSDVVFTSTTSAQARTMTFGASNIKTGQHSVWIEWYVDRGATASIGDRTVVVAAFPTSGRRTHQFIAAPSGALVTTSSTTWSAIPNLSALVTVRTGDEVSLKVSGEVVVKGTTEMWMRARVGKHVTNEEVVFANGTADIGVQSFVFDEKFICSSASITGIQIEWRVKSGQAALGDRTLALVVEPRAIPDLMEAPPLGFDDRPIEPQVGKRKLLTILWEPNRPAPHNVARPVAAYVDALFGAHSVADYFRVNSGGRLTLENAGVLGWYTAQRSWQHYWVNHPGCGQPGNHGFVGGHSEKWVEALQDAEGPFDFASYDTNGDGTLQPSELAILIVIPQDTPWGSTRIPFKPYCDGSWLTLDGIIIPRIAEWYCNDPADFSTAAHELAHLFFTLGDIYVDNYDFSTEARRLSLLGDYQNSTTHLDPLNKLAMGWVTPHVVSQTGWYAIDDVKTSEEVWILPRTDNCQELQEFFVVENRQTSFNDPLYDERIEATHSGVVVWHIVLAPKEANNAPNCFDQAEWDLKVSGNGRRGIRLIRPTVTYSLSGAWDASDYDLNSVGLVCKGTKRNVLTWADGTPSGYQITNFPTSSPSMNVYIIVP